MGHKDHQPEKAVAHDPYRRQFLKAAGTAGANFALSLPSQAAPQPGPSNTQEQPMGTNTGSGEIPKRPFGRTNVQVSALGLGGHHLGEFKEAEEAIRLVHEAIDAGITFLDNCWEYYNGKTENWLGRALNGRRDKVFLMTKVCTHGRGADLAMRMLEESLRRLRTDHLDLWQIHGVSFDNDPELAYAKGGVLEALDLAKKQGKIRFAGFTGHKNPLVHWEMIRVAIHSIAYRCRSTRWTRIS
jgi:aryl-alcohol dehydrogenase-like predicted oxidoreductase